MLLVKKRYFEAIASGAKTTTLRYWKSRRVRPGSLHTVPGLGRVRVSDVAEVSPEAIDENLAAGDGFDSAEALRAALAEHYTPAQRAAAHFVVP